MAGRTGAADSGRARLFGAFCADFRTAKEEINVIDPEIMAFGPADSGLVQQDVAICAHDAGTAGK